jgi:hypothetical protein
VFAAKLKFLMPQISALGSSHFSITAQPFSSKRIAPVSSRVSIPHWFYYYFSSCFWKLLFVFRLFNPHWYLATIWSHLVVAFSLFWFLISVFFPYEIPYFCFFYIIKIVTSSTDTWWSKAYPGVRHETTQHMWSHLCHFLKILSVRVMSGVSVSAS